MIETDNFLAPSLVVSSIVIRWNDHGPRAIGWYYEMIRGGAAGSSTKGHLPNVPETASPEALFALLKERRPKLNPDDYKFESTAVGFSWTSLVGR